MDEPAPKLDLMSKYPQINANTGVSVALLVVMLSGGWWLAGVKNGVENHQSRITVLEQDVRELRLASSRDWLTAAQSETKLEGRLSRMEGLLQDVLSRLTQAERERRASP